MHACISPGARNSPLVYALSNSKNIKCYSHIDERSSAYFALGIAKSTKKPVLLVSTSGTAVANYFPAIIEANYGRIPLIILSSDRPKYLIGTGTNQTINQKHIYGYNVRYFHDVGLPSKKIGSLKVILKDTISHALGLEYKEPPGPVHLNFPFEEPLIPKFLQNNRSEIKVGIKYKNLNLNMQKLPSAKNPIIIVGPMNNNSFNNDIINLSKKIFAPILADPLSQLRYGYDKNNIIAHYDHFIDNKNINPDLIIRFGRKPTSKKLCKLLDNNKTITFLINSWNQYNDDCKNYIQSPINMFCNKQISSLDWRGSKEWQDLFLSLEKCVMNCINANTEYFEGAIARICHQSLQSSDNFVIGNSMPIRDVDMFTSSCPTNINVYGNRGASGIDGIVSTAIGISSTSAKQTLLLIGDVSFIHDINGLLASNYAKNITIVIINNNGGGIFSFLPISDMNKEIFNKYWITNPKLDIRKIAELYSYHYLKVKDLKELRKGIAISFEKKGLHIIEVQTSIKENVQSHKNIQLKIKNLF